MPEMSPSRDAEVIAVNLRRVRASIADAALRSSRDAEAITLIAVTKTIDPATMRLAYDEGVRTFGENRVQEARDKVAALPLPDLRWEGIGTLQRNKVRLALGLFQRIQSVDSAELASEIDRIAASLGIVMPILIQVNVAGETTKHGVAPEDVFALAQAVAALPHLRGDGLMTIAPQTNDPASVRPIFTQMRSLRDHIRERFPARWGELSMGMSDDFAIAVEEGATIVRVGRAIFGARG